ncbi:MAG: hypothetical protein HYU75_23550 [Betaproteobacteria bacterium]|nr:hypothetical protein [Betaproteobacteria bacterium]
MPRALLRAAGEKLARDGEGRSGMVRRLIEAALREVEAREDVERYVRAYREQPQTEEECGWHDAANRELAARLLREE